MKKQIKFSFLIALIAIAGGVGIFWGSTVGTAEQFSSAEEANRVAIVKRSLPSVATVIGIRTYEDGSSEVESRGTGFIATNNGIVVTNKHVVPHDDTKYQVSFVDGRSYEAAVVARDPLNDIALLTLPNSVHPSLPLADSSRVVVGQTAMTIGNSLGRYPNSVSVGIVSGIGRTLEANSDLTGKSENLVDVLQTDAAISNGNSGGPLLNSRGEVIGVTTAIDRQGREIGFAIPSSVVSYALTSYREHGRIVRPLLGVRYVTVNQEMKAARSLAYDYGAIVEAGELSLHPAVVPGSPAAKGNVREGDIILSVNDELVRSPKSLRSIVQQYAPGDTLQLFIARNGGTLTIEVHLVDIADF